MGKLRTQQELQEFFRLHREKQLRKKQREIKAVEHKKKHILDNTKKQEEKALKRQEKYVYRSQRTITIYRSKYIDRFQADDEVYLTREELKQAERRGEGKINWTFWDKLTAETKQQLK